MGKSVNSIDDSTGLLDSVAHDTLEDCDEDGGPDLASGKVQGVSAAAPHFWLRGVACVCTGLLGLLPELPSWRGHATLAVFLFLIAGLVLLKEVPGPLLVLGGLCSLGISGTLKDASTGMWFGFSQPVVWLVTCAIIISGAVQSTGLGRRISLLLLRRLGSSNLGIAYAICLAEALIAPLLPSNTARGGGALCPVVQAICAASPHAANRRYYIHVANHANLISSAMYLTGSSGNLLSTGFAHTTFGIEYSWLDWLVGASAPGIVGMLLLPLLLSAVVRPISPPPGDRSVCDVAQRELDRIGPMKRSEKKLLCVFAALLLLWATESWTGLKTASITLLGLVALCALRLLSLQDITAASSAWSLFLFLGGFLSVVKGLREYGVVAWLATALSKAFGGLSSMALLLVLGLLYFLSMYCFCLIDAHITALVPAFMLVAHAGGVDGRLATCVLGSFSCLCACLTNYSTGSCLIYYALGTIPIKQWFGVGAIVGVFHLVTWGTVGLLWWKLLGWW